jgi:signal transduction histidine kinase/ligand-binding sensor domain-containing protein/AraC-like DNA-binding protein
MHSLFQIDKFRWYAHIVLILLLNKPICILAQETFHHYGTDEGLSQVSVTTLTQGHDGFLWIGTQDGLNRYDGSEFVSYHYNPKDTNSLCGNEVNRLFTDSQGRIWIGTVNHGLCFYSPVEDKFVRVYSDKDSLSGLSVTAIISDIAEDHMGRIWIASLNEGLFSIVPSAKHSNRHSILPFSDSKTIGKEITSILVTNNQELIVGNKSGALYRVNLESDHEHFKFQILDFMSTYGRIQCLLENIVSPYDLNNPEGRSLSRKYITYHLKLDGFGRMWVSTGHGLYVLSDKSENRYTNSRIFLHNPINSNSISHNTVYTSWCAEKDYVWIGSANNLDLLDFSPPPFEKLSINLSENPSLNNNVIFSLYGNKNRLWVGTSGGGLNLIEGNQTHYFLEDADNPKSICDNIIRSIVKDRSERLWLATTKGVSVISLKDFDPAIPVFNCLRYNPLDPTSLSDDNTRCALVDHNDNVWVGTYGQGINRFNGDLDKGIYTFDQFHNDPENQNSLSSDFVFCAYQDMEQNIWIGTQNGLNKLTFQNDRYEDPTFKRFYTNPDVPSSISDNSVYDIIADRFGILWIGTKYGLNKFDPDTEEFQSYFVKDGLPNDVIYSIQEDHLGNIWVTTNNGMSCFNVDRTHFSNYNLSDGIQNNEFNLGAKWCDSEGNLYFGGIGGVSIFHPNDLHDPSSDAPIRFTELRVGKDIIKPYQDLHPFNPLKKNIVFTDKLELKYDQFPFYLKVATLDFHPNKNVQFVYKLLPQDITWNPLIGKNEIQFLNLSPGSYSLEVSTKTRGSLQNKKSSIMELIILPPWWKTWWAFLLYFAIFSFVFYNFYRIQLQRKLSFAESKRLREVNEFKNRFYTNITHEFRTPLTVIIGLANEMHKGLKTSQNGLRKNLDMIERNGASLLKLVDQMLNMTKLEEGKMHIDAIQTDIISFLRYLTESYQSIAASKQIQLAFYSEVIECVMDYDPDIITKIFNNLLSNAIKFTPLNGKIIVHTNRFEKKQFAPRKQQFLRVKIADSGIGIAEDQLDKIFERFYQVPSPNSQSHDKNLSGTGIGLALAKELTIAIGGNIYVESKPGFGSTFFIDLPITKFASKEVQAMEATSSEKIHVNSLQYLPVSENKLSHGTQEKPTLLLVEDNPDVAAYISQCLPDYEIYHAPNGKEGYEWAQINIPDIIISDILMPLMDGYQLCELLKSDEKTDHIPIILLTAKVKQLDKVKGLKVGADAYLTKPFNKEELIVRIENLINSRKQLQDKYSHILFSNTDVSPQVLTSNIFIDRCIAIIKDHLSDPKLNSMMLSKELTMSDSQVYRKIKALTGKSTGIFIRSIRLKAAYHKLKNAELNVSQVAYDTGFKDPSWFSRAFKEEFGISPSEIVK